MAFSSSMIISSTVVGLLRSTKINPNTIYLSRPSFLSLRFRFRFRFTPPLTLPISLSFPSSSLHATATAGGVAPAIALTDNALKHLNRMRSEKKEDLCLRIGVRQGGCSGMSYTMDFESKENTRSDDSVIEYNGFVIVCDPKSLLFLFGMQLDYSDALIGGGFSFTNPNATQTCGCGKSFAAEM